MVLRIGVTMKYSVEITRNFYNEKAVIEQKQQTELFFNSIDSAVSNYNCSIIGERVTGEAKSYLGSSNIYVSLYAYTDDGMIMLESTFIHNGEVQ